MSLEKAQKVIVPQKKNYVPQFLKQRDINSYFVPVTLLWKGSSQARFLPSIDTHLKQAIPSTKHTTVFTNIYVF
jgi:hypothetical protein